MWRLCIIICSHVCSPKLSEHARPSCSRCASEKLVLAVYRRVVEQELDADADESTEQHPATALNSLNGVRDLVRDPRLGRAAEGVVLDGVRLGDVVRDT